MSHAHNKTTANEQVHGVQFTKGRNPSGTHQIEVALWNELAKRFKRIRGLVRETVGFENDALFLKQDAKPPSIQVNADAEDSFDFPRVEARKNEFIKRFKQWLNELVLGNKTIIEVRNGEHWTADFLENAYTKGVQVAQGRLMQAGASIQADTPEDIVSRPVTVRELQRIYARAFENLQDITDDMADTIRQELSTAIAEGENPRKVADRLTTKISSIENSRAATLARTEIINSHADATLNEYERAGAETVSHTSRLTAKDLRVCPFCRALDEVPFTLQEFQNVSVRWGTQIMRVGVPAHPSGRCSPMPELGISAAELPSLRERIPNSIRGKSVTIINR